MLWADMTRAERQVAAMTHGTQGEKAKRYHTTIGAIAGMRHRVMYPFYEKDRVREPHASRAKTAGVKKSPRYTEALLTEKWSERYKKPTFAGRDRNTRNGL